MSETRPGPHDTNALEEDLFRGTGEMPGLMRGHDWSATPLGPPSAWPESLRSSLSICVGSRFPIAIYWGAELVLLYNDAWSPILGTKHPSALGHPAIEVWPEIWDTIGPLFAQVMTSGEATYAEDSLLAMRRHGYTEECYFNYSFTPIRGRAGTTEGVFNAVIETTYRVIAERRTQVLRALAEKLAATRSTESVCAEAALVLETGSLDVPFAAIYVSEASTAHLVSKVGIPDDVPAARRSIPLGSAEDEDLWQLHHTGEGRGSNVVPLTPTHFAGAPPGGPWPESATSAIVCRLPAATGQPIGFIVLGASPRRMVDEDYRRFAEQVADLIATAILAARAFEEERTRAEQLAALDLAKTTFFNNVSHELRTPLTLILGPLEDALRSPERSLSGAELEVTQRNALRLLKLVNTILDFSRIEAGRAQASFVETDISAYTRELASAFELAARKAGLALTVDGGPIDRPVYVDRDMWEKLVLNLLSNALKFTFEGSIRVEIRQVADDVQLEVIDTGTGIPPEALPRIFDRFHRVSEARSRTHEGSGIGLALVSEIVRMHGGTIEAKSVVGEGTVFTVRIPLGKEHLPSDRIDATSKRTPTALGARPYLQEALRWFPADDDAAPRPQDHATKSAPDPDSVSGARVLIADDNSDMREYLQRLLSDRWDVEVVTDGEQALEAARRRVPDLVLSDVMMPRLDGFGLLRALRADPALKSVPIIMLSARAGEDARIEGLGVGADDYLVKPFSSRELLARVTAQLQLSRLRLAARRESDRYRALLATAQRAANIGIFDWDPRSQRMIWSPELYALMGLEPDALTPTVESWAARIHPGDVEAGWASFRQACAERRTTSETEQRILLPDGTTRWVRASNQISYDDATGEPVRVIGAVVDIQKLKELVQQERTARAEAEEASRTKDDFLAMLGHELRNPLAPIMTALHLVRLRGSEGISREVNVIERQAQHLVRLVDDLLDVSRVARGKVALTRERTEIADLVASAIETASPIIESARQTLVTSVPKHGLLVDVDRVRMVQVISNLLTNAAKYTPAGGRISITATRAAGEVVVEVVDNGTGISAELLPKVFDLFVQDRQTLARSQGGLGLGLTIVKSLVAIHGGTVVAASEGPGRGSTFTVRLPALDVQPALPAERASQPGPDRPLLHRRVLVVDDNHDSAEMVSDALQIFGYETATAHDGPQALKLATQFEPDAALLDIGLPVMDGYELAQRLRSQLGRTLLLVAVTGYGQDSDRQRARDAGFDEHLTKPVDFDKLAKLLEKTTRTK